jgi:hypothetical protein
MGLITLASTVLAMAPSAVNRGVRDAAGLLKWNLLFLAVFTTNLVLATLAWVLVGLLMNR